MLEMPVHAQDTMIYGIIMLEMPIHAQYTMF